MQTNRGEQLALMIGIVSVVLGVISAVIGIVAWAFPPELPSGVTAPGFASRFLGFSTGLFLSLYVVVKIATRASLPFHTPKRSVIVPIAILGFGLIFMTHTIASGFDAVAASRKVPLTASLAFGGLSTSFGIASLMLAVGASTLYEWARPAPFELSREAEAPSPSTAASAYAHA